MNQDFVLCIGKYKGKTVKWVMYNDRRYFEWARVNAPSMFEPYQPKPKPSLSDTNPDGKQGYVEPPEVADVSGDTWTNPSIFYQIAQQMLREKGDD